MIRKYLHTRFRVSDMEASLRFYTEVLGLRVIERKTSPRGSELAFLEAPGTSSEIELCSFPASGRVEVPEDLVHLAFQVDDAACRGGRADHRGPHRDRRRHALHFHRRSGPLRDRTHADERRTAA